MPIEPALSAVASEWQIPAIGPLDGPADAAPAEGADFGGVLGRQLQNLADLQADGAAASASLADGTASDPTAVVMAVERAQLSMQLASQLRTKGVEAITDVFHTQV